MTELVFIEHSKDLDLLKLYLGQGKLDPKRLLVVNLDEELEGQFPPELKVNVENSYMEPGSWTGINETADELTRILSQNELLRERFVYQGVDMLDAGLKDFSRFFVWILRRILLVRRVLNKENISIVHLFLCDQSTQVGSILPGRFEKSTNFILEQMVSEKHFYVHTWPDVLPPASPKVQPRLSFQRVFAAFFLQRVRKFMNMFLPVRNHDSKAILFFGNPTLLFPVLEEARKDSQFKLVYYQDKFAPRLHLQLWNRGIRYRVFKDFSSTLSSPTDYDLRGIPEVSENAFFERFNFENIHYGNIVMNRFRFLLENKFKKLAYLVDVFKQGLLQENVRCVVVDQDITEYNKLFILTARSLGIETVEVLHGVPAFAIATPLSCNKKLVWGSFIKKRFEDYGLIDGNRMIITGNPKYDRLIQLDLGKCRRQVLRDFNIDPSKKIVLFTTQPYKSGNNVGLADIHVTRREKECNVRSVLRALKGKNVHLIVKLHPNELIPDFEKEIALEENYEGTITFVQRYDIYTLIAASGLLITTHSNTVLEAIILDIPVITINFTGRPDIHPYAEWGGSVGVYQPDKLQEATETILSQISFKSERAARERIIREFAYQVDGKAAERAYLEIKKSFIQSQSVQENEKSNTLLVGHAS